MAGKRKGADDLLFVRNELSLFEPFQYDLTIRNTVKSTYHPLHSVDSRTSPLIFNVAGNDFNYINLAETQLYIRAQILDASGQSIPHETDTDKLQYAPINNFLHSLFEKVTVEVNDVEIGSKSSYYPYRAYIETVFGKGKEYKKSIAQGQFFFKTKKEDDTNDEGWQLRRDRVDASKVFEMCGRPHHDLFHQNKYLPPSVDLRLTFTRIPEAFSLQCIGTNALTDMQIKILDAELIVTKHSILQSVMIDQFRVWESGTPMSYPMRNIEMKAYTLQAGVQQNVNENLITGFLPDKIVVGLVNAADVHGRLSTNPLIFKDFGLSFIEVTCNSEETATHTLDLDFSSSKYMQAYMAMYNQLAIDNADSGIDLTLQEFKHGKTFFVYDLTHLRQAFSIPRYGNVRIELKFKRALSFAVTVMLYLDYQALMYINSDRQVYMKDFSKHG